MPWACWTSKTINYAHVLDWDDENFGACGEKRAKVVSGNESFSNPLNFAWLPLLSTLISAHQYWFSFSISQAKEKGSFFPFFLMFCSIAWMESLFHIDGWISNMLNRQTRKESNWMNLLETILRYFLTLIYRSHLCFVS